MFNSQHGVEIIALFNDDTSDYGGDESSADLVLCNYLEFWTNSDTARMDVLFRQ